METIDAAQRGFLVVVGNQVPRYSGWKLFSVHAARSLWLLETKYRDIADGNRRCSSASRVAVQGLETKYRDIADGNLKPGVGGHIAERLETKYRDIADGNALVDG